MLLENLFLNGRLELVLIPAVPIKKKVSGVKSCVISTPGFSRFPNISPRPNRPLPSSPGPLYQNNRSAFDMEMFFHSHASKIHFQGCALGLILKVRVLELGSGLQTPLYLKSEKNMTHWRRTTGICVLH